MKWLNEAARTSLQRGYLLPNQSPEERILQMGERARNLLNMAGLGEKFYNYMSEGYYSLSSPIWSNFGLERGLPISCFGSYIADSTSSILETAAEIGVMTKLGGGTSAYFGDIRPRGSTISGHGIAEGSFSFLPIYQAITNTISQGGFRRGNAAMTIPIDHPDIEEWLNIQTEGCPIQQLFYSVSVSDEWLKSMKAGDQEKRAIWAKVLQRRKETGIPYIFFHDNANKNKPDCYLNQEIKFSNLCAEIMLPANEEESFVCCLSSMNLLKYPEWKDTDAVEVLTYFLNAVMEEFIQKTTPQTKDDNSTQKEKHYLQRAHNFAKNHRAIGIGALGWHSLLQSQNIGFESFDAMLLNAEIFKTIKERSYAASEDLGKRLGCVQGTNRRNTTLMSIAPTKSSSFILGQVSPSIEPYKSNYFIKDLAKIKTTFKNPYLLQELKKRNMDTPEIWESILLHKGSVQHLDLDEHTKAVFKTFEEINPMAILQQAAQRQQYIDQGQSLSLSLPVNIRTQELNQIHLTAHELGIKSLYYLWSSNAAQNFNRENLLACKSCEA